MTDEHAGIDWLRIAARYSLNILSGDEIKLLAESLVGAGRWSAAIDEVYTSAYPIMSEVGPHFEAILHAEGVVLPTREASLWILLRSYLTDITQRVVPPREGMRRIMDDVLDRGRLHELTTKYAGDSHGIERLVGCYYEYDDIDEADLYGRGDKAKIEALDQRVPGRGGRLDRQAPSRGERTLVASSVKPTLRGHARATMTT